MTESARRGLLTVGHSNHEAGLFLELLARHGVTAIADVRSQPYSQFNPQFNRETLEHVLAKGCVHYVFLGRELGARRAERECYVSGKARYELIARLPLFMQGLERLRHGAAAQRIALLCSEKDPLTCHRFILICRQLRGEFAIEHILEDGRLEAQAAAEDRLLELVGLPTADLFQSKEQLVEQAYDKPGEAIAFVEAADSPVSPSRATA